MANSTRMIVINRTLFMITLKRKTFVEVLRLRRSPVVHQSERFVSHFQVFSAFIQLNTNVDRRSSKEENVRFYFVLSSEQRPALRRQFGHDLSS